MNHPLISFINWFSTPALPAQGYLLLGILTFFLGPALHAVVKSKNSFIKLIDGFTLVVITQLVIVHLVPHAVGDIGWIAIVITFVGVLLPTFLENRLHRSLAKSAHRITLFLTLLGLCAHTFTDGMALINPATPHTPGLDHSQNLLPFAVILHRLPESLTIWLLVRPLFGNKKAVLFLLFFSLVTILGYYAGHISLMGLEHRVFGFFEALIAGSLLHVMFHSHESNHCADTVTQKTPWQWASATGAIMGFLTIALITLNSFDAHSTHATQHGSFYIFLLLAAKSALALVIAYVISGMIHSFLPSQSILWLKRGTSFSQALKGMAFGLPLPICSCGVVPIYRTLIKQGAPLAASLAFFVATPELGLDALLLTIPLLGKNFALIRLVCAALVALLIGFSLGLLFKNKLPAPSTEIPQGEQKKAFLLRLKEGLKVGLMDSVDHTAPWIILGLIVAAMAHPYLNESDLLKNIPHAWQIPLFALLGMPMYVCATGITPFVAVLIFAGVSPGAAIAFLLTGPATNITTFGILSKLHGKALALCFAALIALLSISLGYVVNLFFWDAVNVSTASLDLHHASLETLDLVFLGLLALIYLFCLLRQGPRFLINQIIAFEATAPEVEEKVPEKKSCCSSSSS